MTHKTHDRTFLEQHYRGLEDMYHQAPINTSIPSRLSVSEGRASVVLTVGPQFWHSGAGLHGSLYFKGLDDAAFFAANSVVTDNFVLTAQFEVHLLAMVTDESLTAVGVLEKREGRKLWARSELFNAAGEQVAHGSGLFIVGGLNLADAQGYTRDIEAEDTVD